MLNVETRLTVTKSNPNLTLILGGVCSGKSAYAEQLTLKAGNPVIIATAQILDDEMRERVQRRQYCRSPEWDCLEEPIELAEALLAASKPGKALLVDCLSLWIANLMLAEMDVQAEIDALSKALALVSVPTFIVANETGLGGVPNDPLTRKFCDYAGLLNQVVAKRSAHVLFMAADLPMVLK